MCVFKNGYGVTGGVLSLWLFALLWATTSLVAGDKSLRFERLTINEGLSQGTITCISQDALGFLWFGTNDGLNTYDGYKFTLFKNNPTQPSSISNNLIRCLYHDTMGYLWVGTEYGLNRFDLATQTFQRFLHQPNEANSISNNIISSVYRDNDGVLWVGTFGGGINKVEFSGNDYSRYTVTRFMYNDSIPAGLTDDNVMNLFEDSEGTLWVGTQSKGVLRMNKKTGECSPFPLDRAGEGRFLSTVINCFWEDSAGTLWIGANLTGLHKVNKERTEVTHYGLFENRGSATDINDVTSIVESSQDELWLATRFNGLIQFNKKTEDYIIHLPDDSNPNGLSYRSIFSLYLDNSSLLWIGTNGAGINMFSFHTNEFALYQRSSHTTNSLSDNSVRGIYEDDDGYLWVGTYRGLDKINRLSGTVSHFTCVPSDPTTLSNDVVYSITEDYESRGRFLWVGTEGNGLNKFDRITGRAKRIDLEEYGKNYQGYNLVYTICDDTKEYLWLGTRAGLLRYEKKSGAIKRYLPVKNDPNSISSAHVTALLLDDSGFLWVGTNGGGLNKFSMSEERFRCYKQDEEASGLSNTHIKSLYRDSSGYIWIGTEGGGLWKFDPKKETYEVYDEQRGLPNNVIYCILEDSERNLWFSSNRGLTRMNPVTGACKNYTVTNGLQSNEFNSGSSFKSKRGELFFGGVNGLNAFFPQNIKDNPFIPPVVLTDFSVFNKIVGIGSFVNDRVLLVQRVAYTKEIELTPDENVFAFEFVALNFVNSKNNSYAYILEGFDKDWNYTSASKRFATYTNLDAGSYVFRVIGSNNDGVWNRSGASIRITIHPPFWKTNVFYLLCGTGVIAIVLVFYYVRVSRLKNQRHLQQLHSQMLIENQELERKRIAQELHDSLGQNILIMKTNAQLALRSLGDKQEMEERLNEIASVASDTLEISREIAYNLRPLHLDRLGLTETLKTLLENVTKATPIIFDYSIDQIDGFISPNNEINLYRIIQESLNNIIKHSGATIASVKVKKTETSIVISIEDNGAGFDVQQTMQKSGLGLVGIEERARILNAKLSLYSETGKGTRLNLSMTHSGITYETRND